MLAVWPSPRVWGLLVSEDGVGSWVAYDGDEDEDIVEAELLDDEAADEEAGMLAVMLR
jgi:hypothetical protein